MNEYFLYHNGTLHLFFLIIEVRYKVNLHGIGFLDFGNGDMNQEVHGIVYGSFEFIWIIIYNY
jgi:hypothetical protein